MINAKSQDLTSVAILSLLGRSQPISRADVARELGVSSATVTQTVRRLVAMGMVTELEHAPSTGGRPGRRLGIVASAGRALGVKVAADHLAIVDVRLDGTVLESYSCEFDASGSQAADRLVTELRPHIEASSTVPLLGLGVAVPGIVDSPDSGRVDAQVLQWTAVPLGRHLQGAFGVPVLVENDVKAVAVAEQLFGRGRSLDDFLVVTIGRGVGLAIVAAGNVYRGSSGGAGEFGHFIVDPDGPRCACGNRGCIEATIGINGLLGSARRAHLLQDGQGIDELEAQANRGDEPALAIYANAGTVLARGVAALISILNPQQVIVMGEGTSAWQFWDSSFRNGIRGRIPERMRETPIQVEPWDDTKWAQGAAALVLATPFDLTGFSGHQAKHVLARLNGRRASQE